MIAKGDGEVNPRDVIAGDDFGMKVLYNLVKNGILEAGFHVRQNHQINKVVLCFWQHRNYFGGDGCDCGAVVFSQEHPE